MIGFEQLKFRFPRAVGALEARIVFLRKAASFGLVGLINTGVDFALTSRPLDGLELGITFGWNSLTMDADVLSGGNLLFARGDRLDYSPESLRLINLPTRMGQNASSDYWLERSRWR